MTMRELRFPWDNGNAWGCLDIPFTGRAVLYASILQADPTASSYLTGNAYPTTIDQSGSTPEESFIAAQYTAAAGATPATGPSYWRVLGSMIVEVED
jgi:hypothetical protein